MAESNVIPNVVKHTENVPFTMVFGARTGI